VSLAHVTIVLVRPQQPGNIGVAARAIANHGVGGLTMVCPNGFDPERARWMAPKAHHVINGARFCRSVSEAVANMAQVVATTARPRNQDWIVRTPTEVGQHIAQSPVPTAILFGPEDNGLSNEDLALAESILTFPTTHVSSLNLGQAVTATCAALRTAQGSVLTNDDVQTTQVPVERREELVDRTLNALETSGYLDGRSRRIVTNTLIRLSARADMTHEEVNSLLGMIKQVNWWFRERSS
jgi:tRNA/rRNA methyltransferase